MNQALDLTGSRHFFNGLFSSMTRQGDSLESEHGNDQAWTALQAALDAQRGGSCRLTSLTRRPFEFGTSFPVEALDADLADGSTLHLLRKDVGWGSLSETARRYKVDFLHDPFREIEVYRDLLAPAGLDTARYLGMGTNAAGEGPCLFLERVAGMELQFYGEPSVWQAAARWAGAWHARFSSPLVAAPPCARLILHDEAFYHLWAQRAIAFSAPAVRPQVEHALRGYEGAVQTLLAAPPTVIHGEFYPTNVLIRQDPSQVRVCPIDWETAGWGPGLIDLAALATGWGEEARAAMADAYRTGWAAAGGPEWEPATFSALLDACRLHLAVRWLGWCPETAPPAEESRAWLLEIQDIVARQTEEE
jgi:hypothetical protein